MRLENMPRIRVTVITSMFPRMKPKTSRRDRFPAIRLIFPAVGTMLTHAGH